MTHEELVQALSYLAPNATWGYDGDGSTLDPVEDENGVLVSRGLEWHDDSKPPTLAQLQASLASMPPPPQPLDDRLAEALAALPQDAPITGSQLTTLIALLNGTAAAELNAKVAKAAKAKHSKKD